jgi:ribosomal protein S18 acetylase RimI-like enzyme
VTKEDINLLSNLEGNDGYIYPSGGISKERFLKAFRDGEKIFIAEKDGGAVGYASIQPKFARGSRIRWLSVHKDFHRQGIGTKLIEKIKEETKNLNKSKLYLYVHHRNTEAITFYSHLRFKVSGFFVDKYGDGEHAILMCKDLS